MLTEMPEMRTPVALTRVRLSEELLVSVEDRMRRAHRDHLGYPYNLVGRSPVPTTLGHYLINNLGDPYTGSHYASEVCDLEREAVTWLMDLWQAEPRDAYWGSVGASGTEGNLWAIYLAREALPGAVLVYSRDAHYSIPKAARLLGVEARMVESTDTGAIDLGDLERVLAGLGGKPVIVALTCGTTFKGAHDDIGAVIAVLEASRYGKDRRYIHVDGALNAMVVPFLDDAPATLRPSFRHAIDSISTSGHKMIGTAMPCGVLIASREHIARVASAIAYLRSHDTTLMGSRNGHAVLAVWARLIGHGVDGFTADSRRSVRRAGELAAELARYGVPVLCNPHALTVVFPQPGEAVVRRYQLACSDDMAHAIVMPSVSDSLLERFIADYRTELATSSRGR